MPDGDSDPDNAGLDGRLDPLRSISTNGCQTMTGGFGALLILALFALLLIRRKARIL